MNGLRYAASALNGDLLRAGIGMALCGLPIVFADLGTAGLLVFAVPFALFAGFGLRTVLRRTTVVSLDEAAITATGWRTVRLAWDTLDQVKLAYFSTRRDREAGWMTLTLRSAGARLSLDDSLDGFDQVARRAWQAARARDLALSPATLRNFAALGLAADGEWHGPARPPTRGWGSPAEWRR